MTTPATNRSAASQVGKHGRDRTRSRALHQCCGPRKACGPFPRFRPRFFCAPFCWTRLGNPEPVNNLDVFYSHQSCGREHGEKKKTATPPMICHDLQPSVYVKLEYCTADAASGCAACPHARARTHASRFLPSYVVRFSYRRHQHLTCASQSHSNDRAPPKILHRRASRGHLWSRHHVASECDVHRAQCTGCWPLVDHLIGPARPADEL